MPSTLQLLLTAFLVLAIFVQYALSIRLASKPFLPEVKRETMVNFYYQSYHQWPLPLSPTFFQIQSYMTRSRTSQSTMDALAIATDFVALFLQTYSSQTSFKVVSHYTTDFNGVTHIYLKQMINGSEVVIECQV